MTAQQTFNEMIDSLTGFEEDRIEQHYGGHIMQLLGTNASKSSRALIFIEKVREGMKSETADENKVIAAAKRSVQGLTLKEVNAHFADDPGDFDPDAPDSEVGKGDSPDDSEPASSQPSAS